MKKWHIIVGASVLVVAILVVIGVVTYKYFILPKYIAPVVEQVSDYLKDDDFIVALYDEAVTLHDEGVMDDAIYSNFLRAYSEYFRDDEAYARDILQVKEENTNPVNEGNSLKTKYASHKVGVEIIKVNDGESSGKSDVNYSDERTSNRVRAEDIVEAEKIISEAENGAEATPTPDIIKTAYEKLRSRMIAGDFSLFTKIMAKLDINTLMSFTSDKEGLKNYLHSRLTDEEYSNIINLGYKYVHVFFEKEN